MTIPFLITISVALMLAVGWLGLLVIGIKRRRNGLGGMGLIVLSGLSAGASLFLVPAVYLIASDLYLVKFEDGIETFDLRTYSGRTGTITLPFNGEANLVLRDSQNGRLTRFHFKNGESHIPAGTYQPYVFQGFLIDEQKTKWGAGVSYGQIDSFALVAGERRRFEAGPPFHARVVIEAEEGDQAAFSLEQLGRGNASYTIFTVGAAQVTPGFEVVSATGEVLWKGIFEYG